MDWGVEQTVTQGNY